MGHFPADVGDRRVRRGVEPQTTRSSVLADALSIFFPFQQVPNLSCLQKQVKIGDVKKFREHTSGAR